MPKNFQETLAKRPHASPLDPRRREVAPPVCAGVWAQAPAYCAQDRAVWRWAFVGMILCFALVETSAADTPAPPPVRPNILLLVTDDQSPMPWAPEGYRSAPPFGYCGAEDVYTPEIDRLAAGGMTFGRAYVSSSVCSASRYTLLTGRYAGRCRGPSFLRLHPPGTMTRVENNAELEQDVPNLAKWLRQAGYRTGLVGKSHLVDHQVVDHPEDWKDAGLQTYDRTDDPSDPLIDQKMRQNHEHWQKRLRDMGFDWAGAVYAANLRELYNERANVHNIEWTNEAALTFIEQSGSSPFFLYYATTLPHGPEPWKRVEGRYAFGLDADASMTGEGYRPDLAERAAVTRKEARRLATQAGVDPDNAWLTWLDVAVGQLRRQLEAMGQLDNTLIIIMSDHGSWRHGKTTLYEGGVRVPLLVHWPAAIPPGSTYDQLVQNVDLVPTLLDLAGVEPPQDIPLDGSSLVPQLRGATEPVHDDLFLELGFARGVVTKEWKYIAIRYDQPTQSQIARSQPFRGWQGQALEFPYLTRNGHLGFYASSHNPHYFAVDQLYHLTTDPREEQNVADKFPEQLANMQARLRRHLQSFDGRPFGEFTLPAVSP